MEGGRLHSKPLSGAKLVLISGNHHFEFQPADPFFQKKEQREAEAAKTKGTKLTKPQPPKLRNFKHCGEGQGRD